MYFCVYTVAKMDLFPTSRLIRIQTKVVRHGAEKQQQNSGRCSRRTISRWLHPTGREQQQQMESDRIYLSIFLFYR